MPLLRQLPGQQHNRGDDAHDCHGVRRRQYRIEIFDHVSAPEIFPLRKHTSWRPVCKRSGNEFGDAPWLARLHSRLIPHQAKSYPSAHQEQPENRAQQNREWGGCFLYFPPPPDSHALAAGPKPLRNHDRKGHQEYQGQAGVEGESDPAQRGPVESGQAKTTENHQGESHQMVVFQRSSQIDGPADAKHELPHHRSDG